ncbi:MAG: inositol monophosphatase [Alphaproteobacteria bacterium]|nr:inositol monophosphatase [Alphaproteobacteria bacterium]
MLEIETLLPEIFAIFEKAGQAVLAIRESKSDLGEVVKNEDGYESVFTIADLASDQVLYEGLTALTPGVPVISEENVYDEIKKYALHDLTKGYFWIIDPIDGTNHFRKGRNSWAVLGALILDGAPVFGIVYRPAPTVHGYYAVKGKGAYKFQGSIENAEKISKEKRDFRAGIRLGFEIGYFDPARILDQFGDVPIANRTELETDIQNGFTELSAYTCCLIAEGKVDFSAFPMDKCAAGEWDVAPVALILEETGGYLRHFDNQPVKFGTPDKKVEPTIAYNDPQLFELYQRHLFASYSYENRVFIKKEP